MNKKSTKERLLTSINTVIECNAYDVDDVIFSQKYGFAPVVMILVV